MSNQVTTTQGGTPLSVHLQYDDGAPTPVENFVDQFTAGLNFSVGPVTIPFGDWLRIPLHPLAFIIDLGIGFVNNLTNDARRGLRWLGDESWTIVNEVAQEVIADAENLFNAAERDIANGLHYVEGVVGDILSNAETFASEVGQEVLHDAESLFNTVERDLAAGLSVVERDIGAGISTVEQFASEVGQEVLHDAEHLFNVAEDGAKALFDTARTFASDVGQEVLHDAESLFNTAEHDIANGISWVESQLVAPLAATVAHILDRIEGDIGGAVALVGKVADWLTWLATWPFHLGEDVRGVIQSAANGSLVGVIARRVADDRGDVLAYWRHKTAA